MYSLIQRGPETFETVKVKIGATNDTMASIDEGLSEGDPVVLNLREHLTLMDLPKVVREDNSEMRELARRVRRAGETWCGSGWTWRTAQTGRPGRRLARRGLAVASEAARSKRRTGRTGLSRRGGPGGESGWWPRGRTWRWTEKRCRGRWNAGCQHKWCRGAWNAVIPTVTESSRPKRSARWIRGAWQVTAADSDGDGGVSEPS